MKVTNIAEASDKHHVDVNHLLYHKGRLYSACGDGKIKVWSPDLKKQAEVQAYNESVFCLAASEDSLFSCSKSGQIKSWDLGSLNEKKTLSIDDQHYFFKIHFSRGCLFYGEERNNIKVFENERKGEKDKDNFVSGTMIFTVKDEDVVVTEVKTNGTTLLYGDKKYSFMGKDPVALISSKYFAFVSTDGKDILIHSNAPQEHFQQISAVRGAHTQDIKALSGTEWNGNEIIFSGGLDKIVKKWAIGPKGEASLAGDTEVDLVIRTIIPGETGELFVGGSDGQIVKLVEV